MNNSDQAYCRDINHIRNNGMLIFSATYYFANFLFRWSYWTMFHGAGVYNWPDPDFVELSDIIFSSISGSLLIFFLLYFLGRIAFIKKLHINSLLIPLLIVVASEIDDIWYSTANEHIRLYDIQLFLHTNMQEHMDLTLSDIRFALIWIVVHIVVLTGAWLLIRAYAPKFISLYRAWCRRRAAILSLGAVVLISTNATSYGLEHDHLWQAVSKRNMLGINVTSFIEKSHPDIAALRQLYATAQPEAGPEAQPPARVKSPKSILVIAVEGLNPSYVNADTMPFFTKLRAEGLNFDNHYSSGNNTLLGTLGLLYGQSPTFFFEQSAKGQRSFFIDRLNADGFKTQVFGHGLESYRKINGYMANFSESPDTGKNTAQTIDDISVFANGRAPSFGYYYYGGTHHPYNHSPAFTKFTPELVNDYQFIGGDIYKNRDAIRNKYRNALLEADHNLEILFSKLPWRNMIIVVTGDHGEAMFENGRLSHSSSLEKPQTHTPLFLYYPGITPGHVTRTTSHLDIMPTLFEIEGMAIPGGAQGRSMFGQGPGMALVMHNNQNYRPVHAALISGQAKVIVELDNLRAPSIDWLDNDNDRTIRLQAVSGDVANDFADFKQRFELNGCALYDKLGSAANGGAAPQAVMNDLRFCR